MRMREKYSYPIVLINSTELYVLVIITDQVFAQGTNIDVWSFQWICTCVDNIEETCQKASYLNSCGVRGHKN